MRKLAVLFLLLASAASAQTTRIPASKVYVTEISSSVEAAISGAKIPSSDLACSNGQGVVWNSGTARWDCGSGGGLSNISEDTSPSLGGALDADEFALNDLGILTSYTLAEGEGWGFQSPNISGNGFALTTVEGSLAGFSGATRDTTAVIGFNVNSTGSNLGNFFNPGYFDSFEQNFDTGAWPTDLFTERHWIPQTGRGVFTVASATGLAENDLIMIEDPANGASVGIGWIDSVVSTTVTVNWAYSGDSANRPASGDTLEETSSGTVTSRSGTFVLNGGGVWVSSSSSCTVDDTNDVAILAITAIANQTGSTADLTWMRGQGPGTALVAGNCIKQQNTGATALLPASITVSGGTTLTSAVTGSSSNYRFMTSAYTPHHQRGAMVFYPNAAIYTAAIPAFQIGNTASDDYWVGIATQWTSPSGLDIVGALGNPANQRNFAVHGKWWHYEPGGGSDRVEVGAPAAVTGTRTAVYADASGTIPAMTLTDCATDDPILADGALGGVKCGTPGGGAGDMVSTGGVAVNGIPISDDAGGDSYVDSGISVQVGATTTPGGIVLPEAPDNGSSAITVQAPASLSVPFASTLPALNGTLTSMATTTTTNNLPLLTSNSTAGAVKFGTARNGTAPPATCTAGDLFLDTDETDDTTFATTLDNVLIGCIAANTWSLISLGP